MTEAVQVVCGATLLPDWSSQTCLQDAALVWQGKRLLDRGTSSAMQGAYPGARVHRLKGQLVTPPLVNAHHHVYSALAGGIVPGLPTRSFEEVLRHFWWRLDRAHTAQSIRLSARLVALQSLLSGCGFVVDHHSSPECIEDSLDILAEELGSAGMGGLLCYEVSDRNGAAGGKAGLRENLRFARQQQGNSRMRGTIGLHASFTLSDERLEACGRQAKEHGCHVHLAEDPLDVRVSQQLCGMRPLERLHRWGLLNGRSLLVHGVHLDDAELDQVAAADAWLAIAPESNANNQVGLPQIDRLVDRGLRLLLGSDGMTSAMLPTLRAAFLLERARNQNVEAGWKGLPALPGRNVDFLRHFLGSPQLGSLVPGAVADWVVWDYVPPSSPDSGSMASNLVYGLALAGVRDLVLEGVWRVKERSPVAFDVDLLMEDLARERGRLEERFHALPAAREYQ